MNRNKIIRAGIRLGLAAVMAWAVMTVPLQAHETKCPHCELDVVQDTPQQDNEVVLKFGKKRIEYKCVMCAIADAEKSYTGNLTVITPTEVKGKKVEIIRKDGKWSAPEGAVFVGHKVKHRYCDRGYRAFTSLSAFNAHVQKNKAILRDAQPISLDQMVQVSKADIVQKKKP